MTTSLDPDEKILLSSLLYRAGIWLSHAEDEQGKQDDIKEMKALEQIIRSIAKLHENSAFVKDMAQQTLRQQEHWAVWAKNSFNILPDCEKAALILKEKCSKKDRQDYGRTLIHIAETVAAAYGEFGMEVNDDNILSAFLGKITESFKTLPQNINFTNISPAEQDAVQNLQDALSMNDQNY